MSTYERLWLRNHMGRQLDRQSVTVSWFINTKNSAENIYEQMFWYKDLLIPFQRYLILAVWQKI
jgi:hypothetical protein